MAALVVVSVGILGIAGTSALSLGSIRAAERELGALRRLELRLAALTAAGCSDAVGGDLGAAGDAERETWTVEAASRGVALVEATIRWQEHGRPRRLTLRSAIVC